MPVEFSDCTGIALVPVPSGKLEFADTVGMLEEGAESPVESEIEEFPEGVGIALELVPTTMLEFAIAVGMLSDAVPAVDSGIVKFAEGVGIALEPVPKRLEFANAVGTDIEIVSGTLVPGHRVMLAVGADIPPEPPVDPDVEKMGAVPERVALVDLVRLNRPLRSISELLNSGPVVVREALKLGLGVKLGGVEMEALAEGKTTPVPPVAERTDVPPPVEKTPVPAETEPLTLGIDDGVMAPDPPPKDVNAVPPEMVKLDAPPVDSGKPDVARLSLDTNVGDGKPVPKPPVELAVLSPPLIVPMKPPDVALGSRVSFEVIGTPLSDPAPPVEKKIDVLPPAVTSVEPDTTGAPVPPPPVKLDVDVAPETVNT